jgi:hypothetical protein
MGRLYSENSLTYPTVKPEHTKLALQHNPSQWNFYADMLLLKTDEIATWALNVNFRPFTTSEGASAVDFSQTPKSVSFDWNFGIRAGMGYQFEGDKWDTRLYYTWFQTRGKNSAIASNADSNITTALLGEWLTFGFASNSGRIQWQILLNAVDWELGRNSPVGKGFSFRPHLGLKGAWIYQTMHSQWTTKENSATENLKNNFWGLGPKGGVNTNWHLGSIKNHSFNLFGDTSLTLFGGRWTFKDIQKTSMNSSIAGINPTTWAATFMFHGQMGFSWDVMFNKNQSNFGVRVGYEFQYWYDQLKIFTFLEGTLHAALVLQGGMLDFHVNY